MSHAIEFLKANAYWIVPLLSYIALDLANGLKKYPNASSRFLWLHGLLDRISIHTNADVPGTLKLPGRRSKRAESSSAGAAVLLPFLFLSLVPSCSCFKPETRNTPACAVLHQIIDCTVDVVMSNLGPSVVALVRTYVADPSQTPNWDGLLDALTVAGIKDGGCIVAQLMADFVSKPTADPLRAAKVKSAHDAFEVWKAKHGIAGVQYKVKVNGREVLL